MSFLKKISIVFLLINAIYAQSSVEVIEGGNLMFITNGTTRIGMANMHMHTINTLAHT